MCEYDIRPFECNSLCVSFNNVYFVVYVPYSLRFCGKLIQGCHDDGTYPTSIDNRGLLKGDDLSHLNPELNPICYLLALLGAHLFLHVTKIRVKILTFRRLMSYIYGAPILDVSRSHTTTQHSR